jgi:hypothetical protein
MASQKVRSSSPPRRQHCGQRPSSKGWLWTLRLARVVYSFPCVANCCCCWRRRDLRGWVRGSSGSVLDRHLGRFLLIPASLVKIRGITGGLVVLGGSRELLLLCGSSYLVEYSSSFSASVDECLSAVGARLTCASNLHGVEVGSTSAVCGTGNPGSTCVSTGGNASVALTCTVSSNDGDGISCRSNSSSITRETREKFDAKCT